MKTSSLLALTISGLLSSGHLNAEAIEDNSFLLEEAYNQEPGVVQFIQTYERDKSESSFYSLSVEVPAPNQTHQLSFTAPYSHVKGTGADTFGLGDIALNYRYQLLANDQVAIAPRLSVLVPSGDDAKGLGKGVYGLQTNWAISVRVNESWVLHTNVGATFRPAVKQGLSEAKDFFGNNAGLSAIWLYSDNLNFLAEFVTEAEETAAGQGVVVEQNALINPGIRYALNFEKSQLVLGASAPTPILYSRGPASYFAYVSYEPTLW